jgi:hypothetical protein
MDVDVVARIHALSDAELFPLGEKALQDIADDIIVLAEIRQRFYEARGVPLRGYKNWREFVEKNSRYSLRTVQRRLTAVKGKDETKINDRFKEPTPAAVDALIQDLEALKPVSVQPISYECSACNGTFEVTADKIQPHVAANPYTHGTWHRPVNRPAIAGWSQMNAGEKNKAARAAGCAYCQTYSSSHSCPAHGWEEKRHDHFNPTPALVEKVIETKPAEPAVEPEPKEESLRQWLQRQVRKIALQPYGYYAAKFAKYPQQHTTELGNVEGAMVDIYREIAVLALELANEIKPDGGIGKPVEPTAALGDQIEPVVEQKDSTDTQSEPLQQRYMYSLKFVTDDVQFRVVELAHSDEHQPATEEQVAELVSKIFAEIAPKAEAYIAAVAAERDCENRADRAALPAARKAQQMACRAYNKAYYKARDKFTDEFEALAEPVDTVDQMEPDGA